METIVCKYEEKYKQLTPQERTELLATLYQDLEKLEQRIREKQQLIRTLVNI